MLDATQKPSRQDVTIAEHVTSEGRGLVICANKWDLVHQRASTSKKLLQEIKKSLHQYLRRFIKKSNKSKNKD